MSRLIATEERDYGPGPPYEPRLKTCGLYFDPDARSGKLSVPPKRFYTGLVSFGASRTWVDDGRARKWYAEAQEQLEPFPSGTQIRVADVVWYSMHDRRDRWRVTHHFKRVLHPGFEQLRDSGDLADRLIADVCEKSHLKEKLRLLELGIEVTELIAYHYCPQEEATHLSLTGVCGGIAPVEECEWIEEVDWPEDQIAEARETAIGDIGEPSPTGWMWE